MPKGGTPPFGRAFGYFSRVRKVPRPPGRDPATKGFAGTLRRKPLALRRNLGRPPAERAGGGRGQGGDSADLDRLPNAAGAEIQLSVKTYKKWLTNHSVSVGVDLQENTGGDFHVAVSGETEKTTGHLTVSNMVMIFRDKFGTQELHSLVKGRCARYV